MKRYTTETATVLALAILSVAAPSPAAGQGILDRLRSLAESSNPNNDEGWRDIERYVERYKDRPLILRPIRGEHRRVHLWNDPEGAAYAVHEGDDLFPVTEPTRVRVRDADPETDHIEVDLESTDGRRGRVSFYGREPSIAVFRGWMDEVFETETPESDFERYFADTVTGVLHARGSEHRVPDDERVIVRDPADPAAAGYKRCAVCFQPPPRVDGWDYEEGLQQRGLAEVRAEFRISEDRIAHSVLQELGEEVLAAWPAPLKGYAYEFLLVEHPAVNAFAVPGGRVFVTSGLVNAIENEAALKAILAHEVAHVESRHSYRAAAGREAGRAITGILDIVSQTTGNRTVAQIGAAGMTGFTLALFDYGRDLEREADMFASVMLGRLEESTEALASGFQTLREIQEAQPPQPGQQRHRQLLRRPAGLPSEHLRAAGPRGEHRHRRLRRVLDVRGLRPPRNPRRHGALRAPAGVLRRGARPRQHRDDRGARPARQREQHRHPPRRRHEARLRRADGRAGRARTDRVGVVRDRRCRRPH